MLMTFTCDIEVCVNVCEPHLCQFFFVNLLHRTHGLVTIEQLFTNGLSINYEEAEHKFDVNLWKSMQCVPKCGYVQLRTYLWKLAVLQYYHLRFCYVKTKIPYYGFWTFVCYNNIKRSNKNELQLVEMIEKHTAKKATGLLNMSVNGILTITT